MKYTHPLKNLFALGLSAVLLTGCAVDRVMNKAEPTAFLNSTGTANAGKLARLPFERSWRNPSINPGQYSQIVIRPVTTSYLRTEKWRNSRSTFITGEHAFEMAATKLARSWDKSLQNAFASPDNRLRVVQDTTQPGTAVLEIAITEVVFGRPVANAVSYASPVGTVAYATMMSPSVAFEARVKDGATGQVIATASDRRGTKIKLLDLSKFTYTESNKQICDEWSKEFVQAVNGSLFPTVKRSWFGLF